MRIRTKLKSEQGASLAAALLFFVFSAAVCSILLSAAATSAGRVRKIKETGQKDITLTSVEKILMTKLDTIKELEFSHSTESEYEAETMVSTLENDIRAQITELYYELYPKGESDIDWKTVISEKDATLLPVDNREHVWKKLEYELDFDENQVEVTVYLFTDFHIETGIRIKNDSEPIEKRFVKYGTIVSNSIKNTNGYEIKTKIRFEDCVDRYV